MIQFAGRVKHSGFQDRERRESIFLLCLLINVLSQPILDPGARQTPADGIGNKYPL